jgi:hypothetical protein
LRDALRLHGVERAQPDLGRLAAGDGVAALYDVEGDAAYAGFRGGPLALPHVLCAGVTGQEGAGLLAPSPSSGISGLS